MVGEIGGVKKAEGGVAEDVAFLRLLQFLADEGGALEADLDGGVAAFLEPVDEAGDLGGAAGAVGAFDDDQFAGEFGEVDAGQAVAVETAGLGLGSDDAFALDAGFDGDSHLRPSTRGQPYWQRSTLAATRSRTTVCWASMGRLASISRK